ncbi:AAA family ATPase [Dinghuibacter silviterrae]|uniref:ATPase family protein associated with various cellular activities (AAA) n=1 Tax=Dinghuibacter silviterrae TaxID=1539049 RepID=A0A4R8DTR7_9BACT|nr:AAA family ATPase [Dinghuibacter silviterrae]TDX01306.1 ATPase family protein associated with various cellular activities (AAA) [Dinghuibacter silviterrae]
MNNTATGKATGAPYVFDNWFVDERRVYYSYFDTIPSICDIYQLKGEKLYQAIREEFPHLLLHEFQYRDYVHKGKKLDFGKTLLVFANRCVLVCGETYCNILHDGGQPEFMDKVMALAHVHKGRTQRKPLEINLISQGRSGFELKGMEVKRTKLDVDLFYEDDFKEVDELIRKRLNRKKDKGIVLLHGLPGTGKTSYLRYLVGKIRKPVLFLSPTIAANLMDPGFIDLLVDNPDSVVIIEDAENIIMDRKANQSSAVSNLLNISDGLLSDFLNVQLICTFNSELTWIDAALLRKGRLIAQYEFGRLGVAKAQRLSDHLGFGRTITKPMTLAEIGQPHDTPRKEKNNIITGFRREAIEN